MTAWPSGHLGIAEVNAEGPIVAVHLESRPETLTFGSSGAGTASHMAAELFNEKAGTSVVIVPYQGGSNQAVSDLLAGRITLMFKVSSAN